MNNKQFKKGQEVWVKVIVADSIIDVDGKIELRGGEDAVFWAKPEEIMTAMPEKPVVPQVAIDYYEQYKDNLLSLSEWLDNLYDRTFLDEFPDRDKLLRWLHDNDYVTNRQRELALATLVVNGVEAVQVEQEKLYTVKLKANDQVLSKHFGTIAFVHSSIALSQSYIQFSKSELEQAGFGWVFDCDGVKVVEVE